MNFFNTSTQIETRAKKGCAKEVTILSKRRLLSNNGTTHVAWTIKSQGGKLCFDLNVNYSFFLVCNLLYHVMWHCTYIRIKD